MVRHGSGAVPLFLIGMATATAAEMVLGLLTYSAPGLLNAITVTVGVQLGALAAGVGTRPPTGRRGGRWRWFVALGAFLIAGFGSLAWSLQVDFSTSWTTRGLSLGAMAAMPMYACGLLISAVPVGRDRSAGFPLLLGATTGVVLFGLVLFPRLQPFGVYLFGVLCISMAAFVTAGQVAVEARRVVKQVREEMSAPRGGVGDHAADTATPQLVVTLAEAVPGETILSPADLAP